MQTRRPYIALALRYRPQDFAAIIGQPTLVQTLSAAFAHKKIAHAYLFTGVRGTGKTTTARILAKALNCIGADGNGDITATPCHVCRFCQDINEKKSMDVIEIDAASHNGVDNVRELLELMMYQPQCRYRVVILDEVHMLSTPAFNALLKTLEEPPPHTKFIFATTNIEKIPLTILSRCQRFDLRRVPKNELQRHLLYVAEKENITLQTEAADVLARASEGSVRDSLSLLDRAIALCAGETITPSLVDNMLGQTNSETIVTLLSLMLNSDTASCLNLAQNCYQNGTSPENILMALLDAVHTMTLYKCQVTTEIHTTMITLSKRLDLAKLSRLWQILLTGYNEVKIAPNTIDALDMVLMRVLYAAKLPSIQKEEHLKNAPETADPEALIPSARSTLAVHNKLSTSDPANFAPQPFSSSSDSSSNYRTDSPQMTEVRKVFPDAKMLK